MTAAIIEAALIIINKLFYGAGGVVPVACFLLSLKRPVGKSEVAHAEIRKLEVLLLEAVVVVILDVAFALLLDDILNFKKPLAEKAQLVLARRRLQPRDVLLGVQLCFWVQGLA